MALHRYILLLFVCTLICTCAVPVSAADNPLGTAGELYSQSVDLANEGKYEQALRAADQALALNATSLNHLIQANRAGILNMLGRYDEAVVAADAALAVEGNLTITHAIAWYNKGDALRNLGRTDEARAAFERAQELDSTLIPPPDLTPTRAKSPAPPALAVLGCMTACILATQLKKR